MCVSTEKGGIMRFQRLFGCLGATYLAVMIVFAANPDLPISCSNSISGRFGWPVVPLCGERFWFSLALGVPGIRAVLAFAAARYPEHEEVFIYILQASLTIAAIFFAIEFFFHKQALLYAIGFVTEVVQIIFYFFLSRLLRTR